MSADVRAKPVSRRYRMLGGLLLVVACATGAGVTVIATGWPGHAPGPGEIPPPAAVHPRPGLTYQARHHQDTAGFNLVYNTAPPWPASASLEEIADVWRGIGQRMLLPFDRQLALPSLEGRLRPRLSLYKASLHSYLGETSKAYDTLEQVRAFVERDDGLAQEWLYSIIYFQGVTALRRGEDENCIQCRGESSCILPILPAAVHKNTEGSTRAIQHFSDYLAQFPDDLEVRWLLNLAHMTLGQYPDGVDSRFRIDLAPFCRSQSGIGAFRDVGAQAGVSRLNWAGGAIMDDFDNDGLLDIVITSYDPTAAMAYYRNKGDGTFEDRTQAAGLAGQLGGLYCVQGDYDNDGHLDICIVRGAWLKVPMRPSLLHNNGNGTFTDVTGKAGLLQATNSITAAWVDYDNDGRLDLYVPCEQGPNLLYRNRGDGTFEEVAARAGVQGAGTNCKGAAWIDYDNDGYPDLFLNHLEGTAELFHNNRDGTFQDATRAMGIDGPRVGFSCWAFDYDNDGWLDLFATSYDRSVADVVKGMMGQPHSRESGRLYHNVKGKRFEDVTREAGLDLCLESMGSNFGDFDNDGYLDMYLGTGDPYLGTLVPNRMFRNLAGKRFVDISACSRTAHLQKGHAVACGDWRRTGDIDIFIETGGAIPGDMYHNVLFQNPGHDNHWLTVKLVGTKTNRAAIGARIKAVTSGEKPLTVCRHVSSGSSFGANPLQQTLGLGKGERVARLEITWPVSGTTQVFRDVAVNQAIEITEEAKQYQKLDWKPVPGPKEE